MEKINETNNKFYRNVAFLMYTEIVFSTFNNINILLVYFVLGSVSLLLDSPLGFCQEKKFRAL